MSNFFSPGPPQLYKPSISRLTLPHKSSSLRGLKEASLRVVCLLDYSSDDNTIYTSFCLIPTMVIVKAALLFPLKRNQR